MAVRDPGTMSFHLRYCRQHDVGLDLHSAGQPLRLLLLSPWTAPPTDAHRALCSPPRVLFLIHLLSEHSHGQVPYQIRVSLSDFSSYDYQLTLIFHLSRSFSCLLCWRVRALRAGIVFVLFTDDSPRPRKRHDTEKARNRYLFNGYMSGKLHHSLSGKDVFLLRLHTQSWDHEHWTSI